MKCSGKLYLVFLLVAACTPTESVYRQLNGPPLRFSDLQGTVILINYWAVWCKPCREEIPVLNRLQKNYPDQVKVLAVNFDRVTGEKLQIHAQKLGIEFSILLDDPRERFAIKPSGVLPETLVINKKGKLSRVLLGPQTENNLKSILIELQANTP